MQAWLSHVEAISLHLFYYTYIHQICIALVLFLPFSPIPSLTHNYLTKVWTYLDILLSWLLVKQARRNARRHLESLDSNLDLHLLRRPKTCSLACVLITVKDVWSSSHARLISNMHCFVKSTRNGKQKQKDRRPLLIFKKTRSLFSPETTKPLRF